MIIYDIKGTKVVIVEGVLFVEAEPCLGFKSIPDLEQAIEEILR